MITLPYSKSIVNRVLIRKALRGEDLSAFTASDWADDVRLLARCLMTPQPRELDLDNCGTAMRFLTAYYAAQPGADVALRGCPRMHERPIAQEVDALRSLGADITYLEQEGFPPLHIRGKQLQDREITLLHPQSTQFVSALLLIGLRVHTDSTSPYIAMTRAVVSGREAMEPDWSAAAFWYERKALSLTQELPFAPLPDDSLQGDRVAADIFRQIEARKLRQLHCADCPDLVPAILVTCRLLHLPVTLTGTESLALKESNRLEALEDNFRRIERREWPLRSYGDHRIAMAFMAAGFPVDDTRCIRKSYPQFVEHLLGITRIIPVRHGNQAPDAEADGLTTLVIDDRGQGKKTALHTGVTLATTPYVWFADADVLLPSPLPASLMPADMTILPLRMHRRSDSLLEQLQQIEYAAIQELTIRSARAGRAVMCSGANLIVNRQRWLEAWPELYPQLPSGDDMFLLESMKRHGRTIAVVDDFAATCFAQPTLRQLLRQRMRWAGKMPFYRDRHIRLTGSLTLLSNLLVVILPPWLVIKWIADTLLLRNRLLRFADAPRSADNTTPPDQNKQRIRHLWAKTLLLTLLYPWYMLICLIGGVTNKLRW